MKITAWIRPNEKGEPTMRVDYKGESKDTPVISNFGRRLMTALEGGDGQPSEEDKLKGRVAKLEELLAAAQAVDFSKCETVKAEHMSGNNYGIIMPWNSIKVVLDCYAAVAKIKRELGK